MQVVKLGGSVLTDCAAISRAANVIASQSSWRVIVVSAIAGHTRQLLAQAQSQKLSSKKTDALLAEGELQASHQLANVCQKQGLNVRWVDARECIVTDSQFGCAAPDTVATDNNCRQKLTPNGDEIIITQGFIGSDTQGNTTTLGFEGSDYSAALMARGLHAEKLVICKDVGGVYHADPHWLSVAEVMSDLHYQAVEELTQFGLQCLHPNTIKPLAQASIPVLMQTLHGDKQTRISEYGSLNWWVLMPHQKGVLLRNHHGEKLLAINEQDRDALQQCYQQQCEEAMCLSQ